MKFRVGHLYYFRYKENEMVFKVLTNGSRACTVTIIASTGGHTGTYAHWLDQPAREVKPKDFPLYVSWPYKSPEFDYYLKGDTLCSSKDTSTEASSPS